jgi:molybdopterin molybdotransferase
VHPRAADAQRGHVLIEAGQRLSAAEIGIAAMNGHQSVRVRSRPRVAILTSGDEVVPAGSDPADHQIRNSNHPMVAMLAHRAGGRCVLHRHLADEPDAVRAALHAAAEQADILVTTGGISAGLHDYLPDSLEQLGCNWKFTGVAVKPGKPARVCELNGTQVVCLPGNPVSALVTGTLFFVPMLRSLLGLTPGPRWRLVRLAAAHSATPHRTLLRPAHLHSPDTASLPHWHGSGDLVHVAGTRGMVRLPLQETVEAGTEVPFTRWP